MDLYHVSNHVLRNGVTKILYLFGLITTEDDKNQCHNAAILRDVEL